jgi:hypothetical protein
MVLVDNFKVRNIELLEFNSKLESLGEKYDVTVTLPILEEFMFPENRSIVTDIDIQILQKKELDAGVKIKPGDDGIGFGNANTEKKIEPVTKKAMKKMKSEINVANLSVEQLALKRDAENEKKTYREIFEETERRVSIIKLQYDIDQIKKV